MYRKLLATTALSLLMTGAAYSQDPMAPPPADPLGADPMVEAPATPEEPLVRASDRGINSDGWLATEITGQSIYNSPAEDAENIGDVNDFVLDQNGSVAAVIVGVGGFLGIGQKNVAINWDDLELVTDVNGEYRLVTNMTREQLDSAAEFDRQEWLASERETVDPLMDPAPPADPMAPAAPADPAPAEPAPAAPPAEPLDAEPADTEPMDADEPADAEPAEPLDTAPVDDDATVDDEVVVEDDAATDAPATDTVAPAPVPDAAPADDTAVVDAGDYEVVATGDVSADELTGAEVRDASDESIGNIGDILLNDGGEVEALIIDFGGFLGIGTKPVAVAYQNLEFYRDENGDLFLRTTLTEAELEAAPEYDEETYATSPTDQLVVTQ